MGEHFRAPEAEDVTSSVGRSLRNAIVHDEDAGAAEGGAHARFSGDHAPDPDRKPREAARGVWNSARFHGMKPIWARPTVTIPSDAGFPPRARKRRETRVAWSVC